MWQIGDGEDYLIVLVVKLVLATLVVMIGLALLGLWLGYKVIEWKPAVGIPLVGGIPLFGAIAAASGS